MRHDCCRRGMAALLILSCAVSGASAVARADDSQLVRNPQFAAPDEATFPQHWSVHEAAWEPARCRVRRTDEGLSFDAPQCLHAVGGAWQQVSGIDGGTAYAVEVDCRMDNVPRPLQAGQVRLIWTRAGKRLHPAGMLIDGPVALGQGAFRFRDVLVAPEDADGARLSLEVHWPRGGTVVFERAAMKRSEPPPARKVKVGSVFLRPRKSTPEKNLELWCEQIDAAGRLGLDIVCLGEAITLVGTGKRATDVARPVPGPVTERLGRAARENKLWVVAGVMEQQDDKLFNTAVLLDRAGKLAGTYRKIHLPREEWLKGITPGEEYPVFQTDFGTVAMQVCYDWFFPEVGIMWRLRGAEIVLAPTWGNTWPDSDGRINGENVFRVRARDNGIYLVPSVYSGNSLVVDPLGRILASSEGREGVVWAEIDLSKREPFPFSGHWRSIGQRHRMPETYGPLVEEP